MADARASPHREAAEAFAERVAEQYGDSVEAVSLFGSTAREEARGRDSDVDLLVVLDDDADVEEELREMAYDLELAHEVPLSLVVKTESEYERERERPFLRTVENDARVLYG